jgi:hypothetical protein
VAQWHRHHVKVTGHRFSIGAMIGEQIVGSDAGGDCQLCWKLLPEATDGVENTR